MKAALLFASSKWKLLILIEYETSEKKGRVIDDKNRIDQARDYSLE